MSKATKKIDHVGYPFVYTDTGERIAISDIKGNVVVGAGLNDSNVVVGAAEEACST